MATKELANIDKYELVQLAGSGELSVVTNTIQENLGGEQIGMSDLERVKVPSGGGIAWTVPTDEGEDSVKNLEGVIIYTKVARAYWAEAFTGENNPPDCTSSDCVTGVGDPGGECAKCPYAQFGTAENGSGQACKQMRLIFLVRPEDMMPIMLAAPPTSLKPLKRYLTKLAFTRSPYWSVVTRLSLEKAKNGGGIEYSKIVPSKVAVLSAEQANVFHEFGKAMRPLLDAVQIQEPVEGLDE